jgi:hypothetical protein
VVRIQIEAYCAMELPFPFTGCPVEVPEAIGLWGTAKHLAETGNLNWKPRLLSFDPGPINIRPDLQASFLWAQWPVVRGDRSKHQARSQEDGRRHFTAIEVQTDWNGGHSVRNIDLFSQVNETGETTRTASDFEANLEIEIGNRDLELF